MKLLRLFSTRESTDTSDSLMILCENNRPLGASASEAQHNTAQHTQTLISGLWKEETCAGILYTPPWNTHVANKANIESTKLSWIFNLLIKQWWRVDQIRECDTPGAIKMLYLIWYAARWRSDTTEATPSNTDFSLAEPGHTLFSAFCV